MLRKQSLRLAKLQRIHAWRVCDQRSVASFWSPNGAWAYSGSNCSLWQHDKRCLDQQLQQPKCFASQAEDFDLITGDDQMARIDGHDARGFLVNKKYLPGSVLCSGRLATLWAANKYEAVTIESLSLLMLMQPAPDLLLLGCGEKMLPPPGEVQKWLASQGVALECLSTANAASTFNILNQEGRAVVGAFLPSV